MNYLKLNKRIIAGCVLALASSWAMPPYALADRETATLSPRIRLSASSLQALFRASEAITLSPALKTAAANLDYLAEKEWQTSGNPRLFPEALFEIKFLRDTAPTKIPAAIEALNNYYKKSMPVIDERRLNYFFSFFFTRACSRMIIRPATAASWTISFPAITNYSWPCSALP